LISGSTIDGWPCRYDDSIKTIEGGSLYIDRKDDNIIFVRTQGFKKLKCYFLSKDNVLNIFDKQFGQPNKKTGEGLKHIVFKTNFSDQSLISYTFFESEASPAYYEIQNLNRIINSSGTDVDQENCIVDVDVTDDFFPKLTEVRKRLFYYLGMPSAILAFGFVYYEFVYNPTISNAQDLYNAMKNDPSLYCQSAKSVALRRIGGPLESEVEKRFEERLLNHNISRPLDTSAMDFAAYQSVQRDAVRNASCSVSLKGDQAVIHVTNISRLGRAESGRSVDLFYSGEYTSFRKRDDEAYRIIHNPDHASIK